MTHEIFILPKAEKDCDALPKTAYRRCHLAMQKLAKQPRPSGCKKLVGEDGYRVRVGDYRVVYRIDDAGHRIYIYRVAHRRDVYR